MAVFAGDNGRILACGHEICIDCATDLANSPIGHNGILYASKTQHFEERQLITFLLLAVMEVRKRIWQWRRSMKLRWLKDIDLVRFHHNFVLLISNWSLYLRPRL